MWYISAYTFFSLFCVALLTGILMMFDSISLVNQITDFILGEAYKFLVGFTILSGIGLFVFESKEVSK
jgi:hypothetical protein